jgi:hypothetical protein
MPSSRHLGRTCSSCAETVRQEFREVLDCGSHHHHRSASCENADGQDLLLEVAGERRLAERRESRGSAEPSRTSAIRTAREIEIERRITLQHRPLAVVDRIIDADVQADAVVEPRRGSCAPGADHIGGAPLCEFCRKASVLIWTWGSTPAIGARPCSRQPRSPWPELSEDRAWERPRLSDRDRSAGARKLSSERWEQLRFGRLI